MWTYWRSIKKIYWVSVIFSSITFPTYIYVYDPPGEVIYYVLTAIAVGDDKIVEHLFPADRILKHYIEGLKGYYPMHRVGETLLAGIWYQDSMLLDYVVEFTIDKFKIKGNTLMG